MLESQSASSIIIRPDSSNCQFPTTQKSPRIYGQERSQYTAPAMGKSPSAADYAVESHQRVGLSRLMRVFSSQEQKRLTCQHHFRLRIAKMCLFFLESTATWKTTPPSSHSTTTRYCGRHSIGWYWSYRSSPAIIERSVTATLSITCFAEIR